jgi:hypothetical protein
VRWFTDALLLKFIYEYLRCKALTEQGSVLHRRKGDESAPTTRIHQAADSSVGTLSEGETADVSECGHSELCAVISCLRKEKKIVDMQLSHCAGENARLKTTPNYSRAALSDASCPISRGSAHTRSYYIFLFRNESVLPLWSRRTYKLRIYNSLCKQENAYMKTTHSSTGMDSTSISADSLAHACQLWLACQLRILHQI